MSMSKNIARLAVTAGLTAALSFGGVMAPVTMAFAAEGGSTVTFEDAYSSTTTYKGIQIFAANVSGSTASNIQWAGADDAQKQKIQEAVVQAIDSWSVANHMGNYSGKNAQDAAEWLCAHANVDGDNSRVASDNVLNEIAKKLSTEGFNWKETMQGKNTLDDLDAGYWLFLTASVKNPTEGSVASQSTDAFTSPIFKLVDGATPVKIAPKKKIPTVEKAILNDGKEKQGGYTVQDAWSIVADSQVGQKVSYKLTGTIADNYATYDSYVYKFTDTLSQGLTYDEGSLEVYALNGQGYTKIDPNSYSADTPAGGNGVLTVNFDKGKGLKSATAASAGETLKIDAETKIVVFYKAELNSKASYEDSGNENNVYLEYSNNPMAVGTGKSVTKGVTDHVFRLDVTKTDKDTGGVLMGEDLQAGFKVKVLEGDEGTLDNKWLGENGEIVDESQAHEFMTRLDNGKVYIPGLDTGKYQITETTTPTGYNTIAPFEITVTPKYKDNGKLDTLTVSSNNAEMTAIGDANGATMPLTIKNKKGSNLPLTGLNGVTFTWIAGGAVLCIGVAHLIRSRKQAEESEQE